MSLRDIASKFLVAFNYDPGHSDLDDEQPIHISVTLGDWRKLNQALYEAAGLVTPEAVAILREIDASGVLYAHNLDLDAKVANFLNSRRENGDVQS